MNRLLRYGLIILLLSSLTNCSKRICPAYQSAFLIYPGQAEDFFSYFNEIDSLPKNNGLFQSYDKTWYGLAKSKKKLIPYHIDVNRRFKVNIYHDLFGMSKSFQRAIWNEVRPPLPVDSLAPLIDSVEILEIGIDDLALLYEETDSISSDIAIESDSSLVEKPETFEQFWYNLKYKSLVEEENKQIEDAAIFRDTVQDYRSHWWQFWKPKIPSPEDKEGLEEDNNSRKHWWQFWKPKKNDIELNQDSLIYENQYRIFEEMLDNQDSASVDSSKEEDLSDKKKRKRKKKNKKNEDSVIEGLFPFEKEEKDKNNDW